MAKEKVVKVAKEKTRAQLERRIPALNEEALVAMVGSANTHLSSKALNKLLCKDFVLVERLLRLIYAPQTAEATEDMEEEAKLLCQHTLELWRSAASSTALRAVVPEIAKHHSQVITRRGYRQELKELEASIGGWQEDLAQVPPGEMTEEVKKAVGLLSEKLKAAKNQAEALKKELAKPEPKLPTWVRRSVRYAETLLDNLQEAADRAMVEDL